MQTNIPMKRPLASCHAVRHRWRAALSLPVLLVALGTACQSDTPTASSIAPDPAGDPTAESAASADTLASAGSTDTSAPTDTAPTATDLPSFATVGTALTNQPSGFTPIAEWAASAMMPMNTGYTSGYGIISGKWARWYNSAGTQSASDGSAPKSSSQTVSFLLPAGLAPGTSYGMMSMWSTTSSQEYSKVYESGWIKVPTSNFEEHLPSLGLKMLGFWAVGRKPSSNSQLYGWVHGSGTKNPVSAFQFALGQQQIVTRMLWPNVNSSFLFTCGTWHRYEIVMEINTIGSANGKFKMWWDGVQTHNYSNVVYRTAAYPAKFYGRKIDPIWGGAGGPNKSRSDRFLIDHLYISGVK
jgi:hypothetical protein